MPQQQLEDAPKQAPRPNSSAQSAAGNGLHFSVASGLGEVIEAWGLVYRSYIQSTLIEPNPFEIHTVRKAVSPRTAVILARLGQLPIATLSAIGDGPGGLPLDSVYGSELDELRSSGRRLLEISLFADRRTELRRSFAVVLELMRYAWYYWVQRGDTDAVVGVHPRHARFYCSYFPFELAGEERTYPTVQNNPVVLLRVDSKRKITENPMSKGVEYFLQNPLGTETFADRFGFEEQDVRGSIIERFLSYRAALLAA